MEVPKYLLDRLRRDTAITVTVRVRPGARATQLRSVLTDHSLKIDLAEPAEDGKANAELVAFLARLLGMQKDAIEILSGLGTRKKLVRITPLLPLSFPASPDNEEVPGTSPR